MGIDIAVFPADMNRKIVLKHWVVVLAAVQGLLTLPPVILTFWLYRLAQRATILIGRWPVPMINDPKWIGENDPPYQHLTDIALQLDKLAFGSFFLWIGLMVLLFRWYSVRMRWKQAGLFLVGWSILWFNPWQRLYWWED